MEADKEIFLVAQLDPAEDDPERDDLYDMGVSATVLQLLKLPDGTVRVLVEGKQRGSLEAIEQAGTHLTATVALLDAAEAEGTEVAAGSAERRVGKEGGRSGRTRRSPSP